ncbi:Angiopoietin-4 [Armadillidium nasatum]|uniref:Angiopoietin-4 n=1 Tax=Armadillidium nasatum TaxID=96803 RepID=A0A5N5TAN6_9CRUS|nr:Angiopoietin-4 [Armadillidium nasatum]
MTLFSKCVTTTLPPTDSTSSRREEVGRARSEQGLGREVLRERLDSILHVLTRLSERMVAIETKQNQQNERIDNINYRITKLDVQNDEQKSQFAEVWSVLRHRLQATERDTEQIRSILDVIKTEISDTNSNTIQINTKMQSLKLDEEEYKEEERDLSYKLYLQQSQDFDQTWKIYRKIFHTIKQNISNIANRTTTLNSLQDAFVTKQDLHLGLAEIKQEIEDLQISIPFLILQCCKIQKLKRSQDCWELQNKRGKTKSGVYKIQPTLTIKPFFVYCDMETEGGGWTVIQKREDGTEDFKRGWNDYKTGFGNLGGEFWMGNEKLYQLTNTQVHEIRIELTDFSQTMATASYSAFATGPENEGYALRLISGYKGDAGDSLSYHVGQKWSTYDMDNDAWPTQSCARDHEGAWWYKACETSNLNGLYLHGPVPPGEEYKGIYWYDFHGPQYSLWHTRMMVRRGGHVTEKIPTIPQHMKHSPDIPHPYETS